MRGRSLKSVRFSADIGTGSHLSVPNGFGVGVILADQPRRIYGR